MKNYQALEKNITDAIIEQQLKLGYAKETVGLYYPAESLKNILNMKNVSMEELNQELEKFSEYVISRLGKLEITSKKDRYCVKVPPIGSEYIHEHMGDVSFLQSLIKTVQIHDCNIEMIKSVFHKYSGDIIVEKMEEEDFDFMICFKDKSIDEYYYCLKQEGCHMIYHRFTKADYMELIG